MILDTSAILAVISDEPDAQRLVELIVANGAPKLSAATAVELNAVLTRRLPPEKVRLVGRLLQVWNVQIVPFDEEQANIASRAYADFGKGSGHPAQLNLGDCFSYALAVAASEPLLFVGSDFVHTDVERSYVTPSSES